MKVMKNIHRIFTLFAFLFLTTSTFAQGPILTLNADIEDAPIGSEVMLHLTNQDFINIVSAQFSFHFDPEVLEFVGFGTSELPAMASSVNFTNPNNVLISWFSPTTNGLSFPDGSLFLEIAFTRIAAGSPDFSIDGDPIENELTDISATIGVVVLGQNNSIKQLTGTVFSDENMDCIKQDEEASLAQSKVRIQNANLDLETFTNSEGMYNAYVPIGEYDIQAYLNGAWQSCSSVSITTADAGPVITNLGLQTIYDCETMSVNIATSLVLYCFDAQYYVNYANAGTLEIEDALIEVELDPYLNYSSSTITPSSINGNLLTFNLGSLSIGQGGSFIIYTEVGCNDDGVEFGQTHCTTATAFPQDDCKEPNPTWDGSSISVVGECVGDEVIFTITNNGADMTNAADFIVIEDELIMIQEPIQLPGGEFATIPFSSNGSTYRAVVEQSEGHPGMSMPTTAVEGCGTNAMGEITLGYVTMFPENDADGFISISCVENRGSYDPNDKSAQPRGALSEHFIEQNIDIEYMIRFQNTGTFTAFNVVVLDTLSPHVDATKIQLGASSHDYTFTIKEGNILEFNFANIMLPDSTMDLAGSNGFVEFRIPQQVDVPLETVIENTAAIYFDFNEPVITNTVFHTVGKDFLEVVLDVENNISEQIKLKVSPNPVSETAVFDLGDYQAQNGHFDLTDVTGKLVSQSQFVGNTFTFERNGMPNGIYFFEIRDENLILKSGKLVVN